MIARRLAAVGLSLAALVAIAWPVHPATQAHTPSAPPAGRSMTFADLSVMVTGGTPVGVRPDADPLRVMAGQTQINP
ncbi:hypothetical protein [Mycolicibacterium fluoranthenivorans]|uniref:Uncharacterized protein n=1 Tax=Mycolicibacterium fluoranthenivorans TaxID=258505 RepID=A0A1G4X0D7_9MYCO|nr:hypothetical protein [Mycolicibacterium fluoranthenivorans]SCX32917.1 hypothetical protein SAMN02799620_05740 [Mycolicibacterium fluoranthenivorans]